MAYRLGGGRSIHLSYEAELDAAVHAAGMPLPQIAECLKTACVTRRRKGICRPLASSEARPNIGCGTSIWSLRQDQIGFGPRTPAAPPEFCRVA